ncbi:acetate CoA-transferase YdiF [Allostella vacuolata]|nr:acetate CoA-transferase YdiF [Stella vacuolata]
MKARILSAADAVRLIGDGRSVIVGGSQGMGVADSVLEAMNARFRADGHPRDLTVIHTTGVGDFATRGMGWLAEEGLVRRVIGGNYGPQPLFMKLIVANKVEAYNLPQGVLSQLYRAMAAKQPGVLTHVGLDTYMDPRHTGAKMNAVARDELIEVVEAAGREWLLYKSLPADVAILRGTTADEEGNVSLEEEAVTLETLSIAQAVHNNGGIVICQVKRLAPRGHLLPQAVRLPCFLVDALVVEPEAWQTWGSKYDPSLSGEMPRPISTLAPDPLTERRVIARRGAFELHRGAVVNLGVGISTSIPNVCAEEGIDDAFYLTVESGVVGGVPGSGLNFGAAYNPRAILDQAYQFDFYDGGGLDTAFLSFAELDPEGNVNVTRFGNRADGCGGFINISQNAKRVVFMGTLVAGAKYRIGDGRIAIQEEGRTRKCVAAVQQVSFSGGRARDRGQPVMYVTERAVFGLEADGVVLREIAPGLRLQEDVLDWMDFAPRVAPALRTMDPRIFTTGAMGLARDLAPA